MKAKQNSISYGPEFHPSYNKWESHRCVENASNGLRRVGLAHEVAKREGFLMDHNGWYMDDFQDRLAQGVVYQLPARNGEPQYVAGMTDTENDDCVVLDFRSTTCDIREAVRHADHVAEMYAEAEREYATAEQERLEAEAETQHELECEVI